MTQSNPLELARQGDPAAIAALMNRSLQPKGMMARAERIGDRLQVILEAEQVPNRQVLTTFVQNGMKSLGISSIRSIRVFGKQTGTDTVAWTEDLDLTTSPAASVTAPPPPPRLGVAPAPPPLRPVTPPPPMPSHFAAGSPREDLMEEETTEFMPMGSEPPLVDRDESLETTEYMTAPPSEDRPEDLYGIQENISPDATTTVEDDYLIDPDEFDLSGSAPQTPAMFRDDIAAEDYGLNREEDLEAPPTLLEEDSTDLDIPPVLSEDPSFLSTEEELQDSLFLDEDYSLSPLEDEVDIPPVLAEDSFPPTGAADTQNSLFPEEDYYLSPADDAPLPPLPHDDGPQGTSDWHQPLPSEEHYYLDPSEELSHPSLESDGENLSGDIPNGSIPPNGSGDYSSDPVMPPVIVGPDQPESPDPPREGGPLSFLFSGWAVATIALIFGILGFAVWSKYMIPSEPSQAESPVPVSPGESPPSPLADAPPATSPSPNPYLTALDLGEQATALTASAQSVDDWNLATSQLQEAIALLQTVPQDSPDYANAQQKIGEYQPLLANAQQQATALATTVQPTPTSTVTVGETGTTAALTCPTVTSTADSQPVEISNLQIQAGEANAGGDLLVGCVTNHTDQPITSVSVSYQGTASDPNQPGQGGFQNITFESLPPRQTVPFTSAFTINPGVTNVSIESIFWTPEGTAEPQRIPSSLVVSR